MTARVSVPLFTFQLFLFVFMPSLLLAEGAAADLDPEDLEIGQVGRLTTRGGIITFSSAPENPIGEGTVLVVPWDDAPGMVRAGRPFILRRVDVKQFPPDKPVRLKGSFKVVETTTHRGRFRYVLEPVK